MRSDIDLARLAPQIGFRPRKRRCDCPAPAPKFHSSVERPVTCAKRPGCGTCGRAVAGHRESIMTGGFPAAQRLAAIRESSGIEKTLTNPGLLRRPPRNAWARWLAGAACRRPSRTRRQTHVATSRQSALRTQSREARVAAGRAFRNRDDRHHLAVRAPVGRDCRLPAEGGESSSTGSSVPTRPGWARSRQCCRCRGLALSGDA